jgi:hypothetical protein
MTYRASIIKTNATTEVGRLSQDPIAPSVIVDGVAGGQFVFESDQYIRYLTSTMDKHNNLRQFLVALDEGLVGTKFYMGFAVFWNDRYKHKMHVYNNDACRDLHRTLLFEQFPLNGASDQHDRRVESVCNLMQQ